MRVLVNAATIQQSSGGTWTYLEEVLRGWRATHPGDRLSVIAHPSFPVAFEDELGGFAGVHRSGGGALLLLGQQQLLTGARARSFRAHAVFNAALSAPLLLGADLPQVSMAHDLRHVVRPVEFTWKQLRYRRLVYDRAVRRSLIVTCGSGATVDVLYEDLLVDPSHARVTPLGADHVDRWVHAPKGTHGIAFAHWANKRPETAIRAWGVLRNDREFDRLLHIIGVPGEAAAALLGVAAEAGVEDLVRLHGRLPDSEFQEILSSAAVMLLPSTLEGFGIPVVEAMRLGVPSVVSAAVGIEQAGGDAALYADADSPEAFAAHCGRLFSDPDWYARVVDRGREHAARFTWVKTSAGTRAAVREAVEIWRAAHARLPRQP